MNTAGRHLWNVEISYGPSEPRSKATLMITTTENSMSECFINTRRFLERCSLLFPLPNIIICRHQGTIDF